MIININEQSNEPIFMQIINQVKYLVSAGDLKPGDQLNSVRELAFNLKVNPNTISKAYKMLEMEGVISTKRGIGAFISDDLSEEFYNNFKESVVEGKVKDLVKTAKILSLKKEYIIEKVEKEFNGGIK